MPPGPRHVLPLQAGLVERPLRIAGVVVWFVVGSTSFPRLLQQPRGAALWAVSYVAFLVLFWIGSDRRASRALRVVCLLGQAGLAVLLAILGLPMFEGGLFALVACQVPLALPMWASIVWAALQIPALWLVLPRDYNEVEIAKSLSSYAGFATFAIVVIRLFESERRARVDLARAQERVRIARDLHDVLGHHLAALSINLDLARRMTEKGPSREKLDEAYGTAHKLLADVRQTVSALRADEGELHAALKTIARSVPEPRIELDYPAELVVKDPACAYTALRCVQEAVTNTIKHARAKHVKIVVSEEGGELMVRVEDDGAAAGEIRPGNGMRGMRERVEEIGGVLEVESVAKRGTTVRARLPMRAS